MSNIQEHFKMLVLMVAEHLDIKVHQDVQFKSSSTAPKTAIVGAALMLERDVSWSMVMHELLHIAVVEKEYRHLMKGDTQRCYKSINELSPKRKKYRSESATLGLQFNMYEHFDLMGYIGGSFFEGNIRTKDGKTDVNSDWIEKDKFLFEELGLEKLNAPKFS